jgi:hypothetical protein
VIQQELLGAQLEVEDPIPP